MLLSITTNILPETRCACLSGGGVLYYQKIYQLKKYLRPYQQSCSFMVVIAGTNAVG
jgi:hypothetical protein